MDSFTQKGRVEYPHPSPLTQPLVLALELSTWVHIITHVTAAAVTTQQQSKSIIHYTAHPRFRLPPFIHSSHHSTTPQEDTSTGFGIQRHFVVALSN